MKVKADLHNHLSTLREDLSGLAEKAIENARKNLGSQGILCIINAQDRGIGRYETFISGLRNYDIYDIGNAVYIPKKTIYVSKGQEVFTKDKRGHLLVLGLDNGVKLEDRISLEDSLKQAKDIGGIIVLDHPCFIDGVIARNPELYLNYFEQGLIDGIEVHNGEACLPIPRYFSANKKAQNLFYQLMQKYNIGAISSSDGHSLREIGTSYTLLEQPSFENADSLRETLRKSIREHKDFSQDKQTNSYLTALNHGMKLITLRILSKLRLFHPIN